MRRHLPACSGASEESTSRPASGPTIVSVLQAQVAFDPLCSERVACREWFREGRRLYSFVVICPVTHQARRKGSRERTQCGDGHSSTTSRDCRAASEVHERYTRSKAAAPRTGDLLRGGAESVSTSSSGASRSCCHRGQAEQSDRRVQAELGISTRPPR